MLMLLAVLQASSLDWTSSSQSEECEELEKYQLLIAQQTDGIINASNPESDWII